MIEADGSLRVSALRELGAAFARSSCLALVLQVSLFPHFAWHGIVPNLCLLVVVGAALTRGPQFAAVLGFVAGVLLDLAPPADHVAGRWALALVVVGYVAGRVRQDVKPDRRRRGRDRRRLVVRRHLGLRASRPAAARPGRRRRPSCSR